MYPTLAISLCHWANYHHWKGRNIEQIICASGHTGSQQDSMPISRSNRKENDGICHTKETSLDVDAVRLSVTGSKAGIGCKTGNHCK